jgi:phage terminase small subunit
MKKKKKIRKITQRELKWALVYVKTGNKSEAYRQAYSSENMKPETLQRNTVAVSNREQVINKVEELRLTAANKTIVTLEGVLNRVHEISLQNRNDRAQANNILMKHLGGYEVHNRQKVVDDKIDLSRLTRDELATLVELQVKARRKD